MVSSIRCRYASLTELPVQNGAVGDWLSPGERAAWERIRSHQRRTTWLAGRVLAKQLLKQCLADAGQWGDVPANEIHIESRSTSGLGERPCVLVRGRPVGCALSIAHTARGVLVAVATEPGLTLGVDLVWPEDCRPGRLGWCFTPAERRWLARGPAGGRVAERLWAMKEAVYKACQRGEGFAPRQIEVVPGEPTTVDSTRAVRRVQCWRVDGQFAALAIADQNENFSDADQHSTVERVNHD